MGFREKYKRGVEKYYEESKETYENPHKKRVYECVKYIIKTIPLSKYEDPILDLCAGSGEVTMALFDDVKTINNIVGCDPYTHELYHKLTGKPAYKWSFNDIIKGCMDDFKFSTIICSYAMHLCPAHNLKLLCLMLSFRTKYLCIVSPHKRPIITKDMGFIILDSYKYDRINVMIYLSKQDDGI